VPLTVTPVDNSERVSDAVLALNPAGGFHIAYVAAADGKVRHAAGVPGSWEITTVDAGGGTGDAPVALAADGARVHVMFRAWRGGDTTLVYARRELDRQWGKTDVERFGTDPAMIVDAAGLVHVAYVYTSGWQLHYARREVDGGWTIAVLPVSNPGRWPALTGDAARNLHLVYQASGELYYAPRFSAAWAPSAVTAPRPLGRASFGLDAAGGVHLAYHAPTPALPGLAHAYLAPGGQWTSSLIDPGDAEAALLPGDLGLDPDGGAHLAYTRIVPGGSSQLRYGYRPFGGAWTTEAALAEMPASTRSVVVDPMGGIHLAFFGVGGLQYGYMRRCTR
jgi:hypothetical protein